MTVVESIINIDSTTKTFTQKFIFLMVLKHLIVYINTNFTNTK